MADDHAIVRSGLCRIATDAFPEVIIGEASTYQELIDKIKTEDWAILILDISLGDKNGLDVIPELKQLRPHLPIIILSMHGERQFVIRALRLGVLGYVTKDRAVEELLQAIRCVMQGKRYLCEAVAQHIAEYMSHSNSGEEAPHEMLSAREYEVFLLLATASSVTEIANQIGLSVKTISTYRNRILEKMGLSSNAQLMRYALEHKLVQ